MVLKTAIYAFFVVFNLITISCSSEESTDLSDDSDSIEEIVNEEHTEEDAIDDESQNVVFKILPVGDSRVQGNRPDHESYRFELWKLLLDNDIAFDFVGTKEDLAEYPTHAGNTFDDEHDGTGGATTQSLLLEIDYILSEVEFDIVLLGIGGNDLDGGESVNNTIENINILIDKLQSKNEDVVIILEQIAPATSSYMTPERSAILQEFNEAIIQVGDNQTNETSLVVPVNMFSDWKDDYLADSVHYNEQGAKEVAHRYFKTLDTLLSR